MSLPISIHSLPGQTGRSLGAAAEPSRRALITAALRKQGQSQERFIMVGVEINRLPETILRTLAVAAGLADHSHQTIRACGETRFLKVLLAKRNRITETTLVGQLRCAPQ